MLKTWWTTYCVNLWLAWRHPKPCYTSADGGMVTAAGSLEKDNNSKSSSSSSKQFVTTPVGRLVVGGVGVRSAYSLDDRVRSSRRRILPDADLGMLLTKLMNVMRL